jgi:hypothetical protein
MYRIDNATAVEIMPTPAAVGPNPDGFFTRGDPTTATPATIVDDHWLNAVQEEITEVIEQAGIELDKNNRTQLYEAIQLLLGVPYGASSSSPNTYAATVSPAISAYNNGTLVLVKFNNANTGSATINLNTLGAVTMKRPDGDNLASGDISNGMIGVLSYDGTNFQLLNAQTIKPSYIQNNVFIYAADTGSANALVADIAPAPSVLTAGLSVYIKVAANNTSASTLNLNGTGATSIKLGDGSNLRGGELCVNQIAHFSYDGTYFKLLNPYKNKKGLQYFTSSGSFTVPQGIHQIQVEVWGGGGGGSSGSVSLIGNGGGGGGYGMGIFDVTPGDVLSATIGAAGAAGIFGSGGTGGTGGTTSFGGVVSATGGAGGVVGAGSGGTGGSSAATFAIAGQSGTYGGGGSPIYTPSGGASGRGGSGAVPSAGARSPGGGGCGGAVSNNGSAGAAGACLVTW